MPWISQGRRLAATVALAAGITGVAGTAAAQTITLAAALSGAQEVAATPVVTTASGYGTLTYNLALGTIVVALRAEGLTAPTVGVGPGGGPGHVHLGAPGVNGGIAIPVTVAPVGATSFDVVQTYTFADLAAFGVSAGTIATLTTTLNGLAGAALGAPAGLYFNVHTSRYPGGEIRGDLTVTPEPASTALVAAGLGVLGVAVHRRRRRAR